MKGKSRSDDQKSKELLESSGDDISTNRGNHTTSNINSEQIEHFLSWTSEVFRSVKKLSQQPVDTTQANEDTTQLRHATNPALNQHDADESMSLESEHSSDKPKAFYTGKLSPTIKKLGFKHNNVDNPEILKKETDVDNIEAFYSDLMY